MGLMNKPEFLKIAEYLYEKNGFIEVRGEDSPDNIGDTGIGANEHALIEKLENDTGVDTGEFGSRYIIESMEKLDLINKTQDPDYARMELTKNGFRVVQDRKLQRGQTKTNWMTVILTFALVVTAGIQASQAVTPLYGITGAEIMEGGFLLILIAVVMAVVILWKY